MNKKILRYSLIGVLILLLFIVFLPKKNKDEKLSDHKNVIIEDKYNVSENLSENPGLKERYSLEDLEETKKIAIQFSKDIYSIDSKEPLKYPKSATNYTNKALSERIIGIAKSTPLEIYKREVTSVTVIEPIFEDYNSIIMWNIEVMADIYDENNNLIGREKGVIDTVFTKEKDNYKVGEYSVKTYPKVIED